MLLARQPGGAVSVDADGVAARCVDCQNRRPECDGTNVCVECFTAYKQSQPYRDGFAAGQREPRVVRNHLTLRASAMPLVMACPGAAREPSVRVDPHSKPAGLGSAIHEALRPVVEDQGVPWDRLPDIAARWGVDVEELRPLTALGAKLWPLVADRFPMASTELALSCGIPGPFDDVGTLTGHIDLVSTTGRVAEIGDWKTGRLDGDHRAQVTAYAVLALMDDPTLSHARCSVLWLREAEIEEYTVTRQQAEAWLAEVRDRVIAWDGVYHPGTHCAHCPRSHECAAANAYQRRDVAIILDTDEAAALTTMTPEQVVGLYKQASHVEKLAKRVRDAVKAHVEAAGGELATEAGRLVVQVEKRNTLDTMKAWPVLEAAGFGDEDLADCVSVSLSDASDVAAKKAGRGKGAPAVLALKSALAEAGAVKTTEIRKLVVKR